MSFLSSLLDTTINADISEGYLLNHSKTKAENFSTIYVLSDLLQNEDNDLVIVKNLYLSKDINFDKDQLIFSKQYVLKKINLNELSFINTKTQKGVFSAYKGIVKKVVNSFKKKGSLIEDLVAVIGPSIAYNSYEVQKDFKDKFLKKNKSKQGY